jgi:N6-adenosine-specific RNA methylase IME4
VTRYRTIVADSPWEYEPFRSTRGPGTITAGMGRRSANLTLHQLQYEAMSVDEIAALPVAVLADDDCRLFLWTTQRYMPSAFEIVHAWGFSYRQTLVWHKLGFSPFGGSVAPNNVEFLLVASKGAPELLERGDGCILTTRGNTGRRAGGVDSRHSCKPDAWIDWIERISPGPRAELFSRRARFGWDYPIGDQALGGVAA